MRTFSSVRYDVFNALIISYFIVTIGGMYTTFTHQVFFILPKITLFSYGMLAPYQGDIDENIDLAVVAWRDNVSTLIFPHGYFPGIFAERNERMLLSGIPRSNVLGGVRLYTDIFSQLLFHERMKGNIWDRLDLYRETWLRSPWSYEENRPNANRTFLLSVR